MHASVFEHSAPNRAVRALVVSRLDALLKALEAALADSDSYVYLSAIQCLSELAFVAGDRVLDLLFSRLSLAFQQVKRTTVAAASSAAAAVPHAESVSASAAASNCKPAPESKKWAIRWLWSCV